jgi:hypothetical protein
MGITRHRGSGGRLAGLCAWLQVLSAAIARLLREPLDLPTGPASLRIPLPVRRAPSHRTALGKGAHR